jgi:branched-chain amino acid transport system permease protein
MGQLRKLVRSEVWLFLGIAVLLYLVIQLLISFGIINTYQQSLFLKMATNVIFAVSLHLIIGITGQFSIGHAGFSIIGAYMSAIVTVKLNLAPSPTLNFIIGILLGGVVSALVGVIIGIPTLRLRGDYLAIATLGFTQIMVVVFNNIEYVNAARGMRLEVLTNWPISFIAVLVTILVIRNFTKSRHGRACIAIREDEVAAQAMGINTTFYKVAAFAIGAFFAGVAGALLAHQTGFLKPSPSTFGFMASFFILIFVVLGGLGSLSGSIIAAVLLTFVDFWLQSLPNSTLIRSLPALLQNFLGSRMLIYSTILVLVMLFRPQGLMGKREVTDLFLHKSGALRKRGRQ